MGADGLTGSRATRVPTTSAAPATTSWREAPAPMGGRRRGVDTADYSARPGGPRAARRRGERRGAGEGDDVGWTSRASSVASQEDTVLGNAGQPAVRRRTRTTWTAARGTTTCAATRRDTVRARDGVRDAVRCGASAPTSATRPARRARWTASRSTSPAGRGRRSGGACWSAPAEWPPGGPPPGRQRRVPSGRGRRAAADRARRDARFGALYRGASGVDASARRRSPAACAVSSVPAEPPAGAMPPAAPVGVRCGG